MFKKIIGIFIMILLFTTTIPLVISSNENKTCLTQIINNLSDKDGDWTEIQKLLVEDGGSYDNLGFSISVDGDTALIGAPQYDDNTVTFGSAYVFIRSGSTWIQQQKLTASDSESGDFFGFMVSLDGDTALIAAVGDDDNGINSGAVYVFTRSGNTWSQQQKLLASDGTENDSFGNSVCISGDTALIGATHDDDKGSAYAFIRIGINWVQQAKLTASDSESGDFFGFMVSLDGDTAIIGASCDDNSQGSAYVFTRYGNTWIQQAKLLASDGASGDYFGGPLSLDADTALIGAYGNDEMGDWSGAVYVFTRTGSVWTQQQKLLPPDGTAQRFGASISLCGDTAFIGTENGFESVYVFTRSSTNWTRQQKLMASDASDYDYFGWSISLDGDTAFIGAFRDDDNGVDSGSVYVFTRENNETSWTFAVITDLHIGRGYENYEDEDYYLTNRLNDVVDWIIANRIKYNVKFVVVLGDIGDEDRSACYKKPELEKAKEILDRLNDSKIPYIPVLGNHDINFSDSSHPYARTSWDFEDVFSSHFLKLKNSIFSYFDKQNPDTLGEIFENYAFSYNNLDFIVLDFVSRAEWGDGNAPWATLNDLTKIWLDVRLSVSNLLNRKIILLSHHPMKPIPSSFWLWDIENISEIIQSYPNAKVQANLAGHIHGFEDLAVNKFFNASINYSGLPMPAYINVLTTEAMMVASNTRNEPKPIIRLVEVKDDQVVNIDNIQGYFSALNPYLKIISNEGNTVQFEAYAFTKPINRDFPISYIIDYNYDDNSKDVIVTESNNTEFFSYSYQKKGIYHVTLKVEGVFKNPRIYNTRMLESEKMKKSELIQESITKKVEISFKGSPPCAPTISGPLNANPGVLIEYTFVSTDPDNDDIFEYMINWGDENQEPITGPFDSGQQVKKSHIWNNQGNYKITAKAKDINNVTGPLGTFDITIPRNKIITTIFLQRFLQTYPYLLQLLQKILNKLGQ